MDLGPWSLLAVGAAGLAAGFMNAVAGGGTLVSFPTLTAVGIPAVEANITNTVALCPGYLGGSVAQRDDLRGQRRRLAVLGPCAVVGGAAGGLLLLTTDEATFRRLIPWLILLATGLLAVQGPIRRWLNRRLERRTARSADPAAGTDAESAGASTVVVAHPHPGGLLTAAVAVTAAAVYGGFFGGALGIILLAVLGLVIDDTLVRLNALKQVLSLGVNLTAAVLFVFSGRVVWEAAVVMAVGALIGAQIGGRLVRHLPTAAFRAVIVVIGLVVAGIYFVK